MNKTGKKKGINFDSITENRFDSSILNISPCNCLETFNIIIMFPCSRVLLAYSKTGGVRSNFARQMVQSLIEHLLERKWHKLC